ncbi:hypothetical protein ACFSCX_02105 [Bacillus salitolerans]|uniref:Uncharacterized protein n=1 Tax=Bacillus salitolerans TaxID=1437434 RepID=A0ABW4LJY2_9BACI
MCYRPWDQCGERNSRRNRADVSQRTGDNRLDDQTTATAVGAQIAAAGVQVPVNAAVNVQLLAIPILSPQFAYAADAKAIVANGVKPESEVETGSNSSR